MSTTEEARIRQARVHRLIEGGESVVVDASFVPDAAAAAAATAAASSGFQVASAAGGGSGSGTAAANSRDASRVSAVQNSQSKSKSSSSNSPSTSRNRHPAAGGQQQPSPLGPGGRGGDLPRDTLGIGLKFSKETVAEGGGRSVQPSSLAQQLRLYVHTTITTAADKRARVDSTPTPFDSLSPLHCVFCTGLQRPLRPGQRPRLQLPALGHGHIRQAHRVPAARRRVRAATPAAPRGSIGPSPHCGPRVAVFVLHSTVTQGCFLRIACCLFCLTVLVFRTARWSKSPSSPIAPRTSW